MELGTQTKVSAKEMHCLLVFQTKLVQLNVNAFACFVSGFHWPYFDFCNVDMISNYFCMCGIVVFFFFNSWLNISYLNVGC